MGGDSGGGPSQQTVTQTNLPEYARPYFERLMARTEASSNGAYTPYGGQRVEGMNAYQNQAMANAMAAQNPSQVDTGSNFIEHAGRVQANSMNFETNPIASTYQAQATQMFGAPSSVKGSFDPGGFDGSTAQQYMSPYQQNVIDIAKREAVRQNGIADVGRDAQAAQRGSFGGSRAALVKQEAQRNLGQQLDDIQMKGSQAAYENAQQQYERDRQAQYAGSQQNLNAQQFNSQQQMAYGQAGMQNQQYNEQQRMQQAQMGLQGQISNEQARQGAAGIRQNAINSMSNIGTQLVGAGNTYQTLANQRTGMLYDMGNGMQTTNQAALDRSYDDFVNQRDYDKQQLAFYSGIMRGVPASANSDVRQSSSGGNNLTQLAGLGIAGLGAYNTYNK